VTRSRRVITPMGRFAIAAIAAGLIPTVAACDAGNNAPTLQYHPQSNGVDATVNGIEIRDAFVLGAPSGATIPAGQSAGVFLALYNNTTSADTLSGATAAGAAQSVTIPAAGIRVGSSQAAYLTGPKPEIVLTGLTQALQGGTVVRVTLSFTKAGSITLSLPVLPRSDIYGTFSPAPSPSPTATKSGATGVVPASPPPTSPAGTGSPSASSTASPNPTA
jgi:copper(I)-binding protein